ncbi:SMN complex subunit Gem6 [Schizosaccharomyces osmophilus]|uniref:SMN complex subunit Gem6 n=1 Tax=Schizosaccharomyces osmophilus TaxID=2545709 RepID=A0AAE9W878_9SCHI|nr:SMN complex subunit Gem6 [Schizosaccharomyces osmophilus]WBW70662.1 SMN complex subunit Gem6 [Schizosaccharomyces osmophilus]
MDSYKTKPKLIEENRGRLFRVLFRNDQIPVEGFLWNIDPVSGTLFLLKDSSSSSSITSSHPEEAEHRVYSIMSDAVRSFEKDDSVQPLSSEALLEWDQLLS